MSSMCTSSTFVTRLQQGGLGVVKVLLVSCEPLDPEELPVRLRPPPYNVTFPLQGWCFTWSPSWLHQPCHHAGRRLLCDVCACLPRAHCLVLYLTLLQVALMPRHAS